MERIFVNDSPMVEIDGLEHRYGKNIALAGIDFQVERGEIFGLLGPNWGGKTTLFRILSTLIRPYAGTARILGTDVNQHPEKVRRHFGVVFQSPSLDKELTARENLVHQGHLYALNKSELRARCDTLLEQVGLADRAGDRIKTFSGGMQRRLEVAKGLLHQPELLFLDEPTTGLDPGARSDLWQYLNRLCKQDGVTILVTTHLMEEAERCDRLVILDQGKIVSMGSPTELKQQIGGDVVSLQTADPETLLCQLRERFDTSAEILNGTVRFEYDKGHELVRDLLTAFGENIDSVTIGKPNLEDVFIRHTGHQFWEQNLESTR